MGCCGTSRTTFGNIFDSDIFVCDKTEWKSNDTEDQQDYMEVTIAKKGRRVDILLDHIDNDLKLKNPIEMKYYWCEKIKTLGSLSTLYLASLISSSTTKNKTILQENLTELEKEKEKLMLKLDLNLSHKDTDRKELTLILILFLVEQNSFQEYLIDANFFSKLMSILQKEGKEEVKCAILQILKELFKNRNEYIKRFCEMNGIEIMIQLLSSSNLNVIFDTLVSLDELSKVNDERHQPILKLLYSKEVLTPLKSNLKKMKLLRFRGKDFGELQTNIINYTELLIKVIEVYNQ